jgi:hypothetical protein
VEFDPGKLGYLNVLGISAPQPLNGKLEPGGAPFRGRSAIGAPLVEPTSAGAAYLDVTGMDAVLRRDPSDTAAHLRLTRRQQDSRPHRIAPAQARCAGYPDPATSFAGRFNLRWAETRSPCNGAPKA